MPHGRPLQARLAVTPKDRVELLRWTKQWFGAAGQHHRALRGWRAGARTSCHPADCRQVARRLIHGGLAGLLDERVGAPRTISDAKVDRQSILLAAPLPAAPPRLT